MKNRILKDYIPRSIYFEPKMLECLRECADQEKHHSVAAVVRRACAEYLERAQSSQKEETKR